MGLVNMMGGLQDFIMHKLYQLCYRNTAMMRKKKVRVIRSTLMLDTPHAPLLRKDKLRCIQFLSVKEGSHSEVVMLLT